MMCQVLFKHWHYKGEHILKEFTVFTSASKLSYFYKSRNEEVVKRFI